MLECRQYLERRLREVFSKDRVRFNGFDGDIVERLPNTLNFSLLSDSTSGWTSLLPLHGRWLWHGLVDTVFSLYFQVQREENICGTCRTSMPQLAAPAIHMLERSMLGGWLREIILRGGPYFERENLPVSLDLRGYCWSLACQKTLV